MSYNIEFSTKARKELIDGWDWYEDKQLGLGDRFRKVIYKAAQKLAQGPENNAVKHNNFREVFIKTFPYLIIYRINSRKKIVVIVSIFHTSRNPNRKIR